MCNVALGLLDVWQERTCGGVGELSKIAEQRAAGKVTGGGREGREKATERIRKQRRRGHGVWGEKNIRSSPRN